MSWIQLASGARYDFAEGRIEGTLDPELDLCLPLRRLPRFLGHTSRPWSVAHHSYLVSRIAAGAMNDDPDAALAGLLHDAHEAFIGDVPTPLSRVFLPDLAPIKRTAQHAIEDALGVPRRARQGRYLDITEAVAEADAAALWIEALRLLPGWAPAMPPPPYRSLAAELMDQLLVLPGPSLKEELDRLLVAATVAA